MNKVFEQYPNTRMRRLRTHEWVRDMVQEHRLHPSDLILPIFVVDGTQIQQEIPSLPGMSRLSPDLAVKQAEKARDLGLKAIALFPVIDKSLKSNNGAEAMNPKSLICQTIQAIKAKVPEIGVIADVALDPYTTHGHDGIINATGTILNDETAAILATQSLTLAEAGADILAPSDMMDGRIGIIRQALESQNHHNTLILSYAAKFASCFYGPFRDALGTQGVLQGDKKTYQMNPANGDEALREVAMDIAEGADMIMVKPGLPYLDIIHRIKTTFQMPTFGYHVSGEYAMLHAAAERDWLNYDTALMESLLSFKRAGCDSIVTYGALDAARILNS